MSVHVFTVTFFNQLIASLLNKNTNFFKKNLIDPKRLNHGVCLCV